MNIKSLSIITILFLQFQDILSLSTPDFIQNLWKKLEQEIITKEYDLNIKFITVENLKGNIKIKTWPIEKVSISATKLGTKEEIRDTQVSINPTNNQVDIKTLQTNDKPYATVNYIINMPEKAMLKIQIKQKGDVELKKNIKGAIDIFTKNGSIEVIDTTENVVAKTGNGQIKIKQRKLNNSNIIFAETQKGNLYLSLPKKTNANLHAKTQTGVIRSEHVITFSPVTAKLNKESWELIKKEVHGAIGSGGAPITLESKGNIILTEY